MAAMQMANRFYNALYSRRLPTYVSLDLNHFISSSAYDDLYRELTARRLPLTYDYLSPQPSHLLNLSLVDTLPDIYPSASIEDEVSRTLPSSQLSQPLPPGHHLIYFPPQVRLSQLLPDGTDVLHSPGDPFNRRLWAGGNIKFASRDGLSLNGQRAVCVETIRDVTARKRQEEGKVLVSIERRFTSVREGEEEEAIRRRVLSSIETGSAIIERRDLMFLQDQESKTIERDAASYRRNSRLVKSPAAPEISHKICPTRALLFRYSALTFNAHLIHLDKAYTQDVEGHPNLLVHGPLSLTLMLTVISFHLARLGRVIKEIEYRNLVPLYVDEEMKICARAKNSDDAWEVWVEGPEGGLAVRGTVWTEYAQS